MLKSKLLDTCPYKQSDQLGHAPLEIASCALICFQSCGKPFLNTGFIWGHEE